MSIAVVKIASELGACTYRTRVAWFALHGAVDIPDNLHRHFGRNREWWLAQRGQPDPLATALEELDQERKLSRELNEFANIQLTQMQIQIGELRDQKIKDYDEIKCALDERDVLREQVRELTNRAPRLLPPLKRSVSPPLVAPSGEKSQLGTVQII